MNVNGLKRMAGGALLLTGLAAGFALGQMDRIHAQEASSGGETAAPLQVMTYASGLTGVFDPVEGRIYLYDSNLENCVAIRELETPGEPMKRIKN